MYTGHDYGEVLRIYSLAASACSDLVREVLAIGPADFGLKPDGERGLPGDPAFRQNGWWHRMLARYFFAGWCFCRRKNVLELCSGLGWGARIISRYAASVTALELDAAVVERVREVWAGRSNIRWLQGDALRAEVFAPGEFDSVLAMEALEHFTRPDGELLIRQAHGLLKKGGTFVMSSFFPNTREEAAECLRRAANPHHLNLFTRNELAAAGASLFSEIHIYGAWLAVLKK